MTVDPRARLRAIAREVRKYHDNTRDPEPDRTSGALHGSTDHARRAAGVLAESPDHGAAAVWALGEPASDGSSRSPGSAVLREPAERAGAVVRALASAGVHRELVVVSGWTPEAYERWLGEVLADVLL